MKPQNPSLYHFDRCISARGWRGESLNWMRTLWCLPFVHKSIINRHLCFVSALKDDGGIINVMLFPKGIGVDTMQPGDNNLDHSLAAVWTIWIIHWGCNKKESKLGRNKAIGQFSHDFEWKEEKRRRRRINGEFPIKIKNCWHVTQSTFHYRFVFCFRHRLGIFGLNVPGDQQSSWFIHLSSQRRHHRWQRVGYYCLAERGTKILSQDDH